MKNQFDGVSSGPKKSNVTALEENVLKEIESIHSTKKLLSEEIEKEKMKGETSKVLELEEVLELVEKDYKKLSATLDEFEPSEN